MDRSMSKTELCGSCGHLIGPTVGAGVRYCDQYKTWQFPDQRPAGCNKHIRLTELEALLIQLRDKVAWNIHALNWVNGDNVGTPTDPRHASASQMQLRAFKMADGTGL